MKVMVLVKASKDSEAGNLPTPELLAEMGKFNSQLLEAGILLAGEGLHPSSAGYRVRFSGSGRTVTQGPFAETKELVAGFWLWEVKSMEEAIEWVKRCPNPMTDDSDIEIRRVFAPEDFAPIDPSGELRAAEEQMRADVQANQLRPTRYEQWGATRIVGLNESYTFETRSNIPAQWARFVPLSGKVPGHNPAAAYGVCWNYRPQVGFDYLTGVEVSGAGEVPPEFTAVSLPAQQYAVFAHTEHVSTIPKTLDAIWQKWLPKSGHRAAASPSFERYTSEFNPQTGLGGMEVWIPLES